MKNILAVLGFISALTMTSQAMADCVNANDLRSFRVMDSRTLDVQTVFGEVYRMNTSMCSLWGADRISFEHFYVCPGDNLLVLDYFNQVQDRCWIQRIQRIH